MIHLPQPIRARPVNGWQENETCCLDISLNNRYQEGLYFESMCSWVNKRFKNCIISLGDTLHRHNLMFDCGSIDVAHTLTRDMGDRWLAQNGQAFDLLRMPWRVMRSDDWLAMTDFRIIHQALWSFYKQDVGFQACVEKDIEGFVARNPHRPRSQVCTSSLAYLLEETAADILLGQQQPVTHLYPGKWHDCYFYLMDHSAALPDTLRGLEECAFKRLAPSKILHRSVPRDSADLSEAA